MTEKQNLFIHEYLKDFNATQAAIKAGYSEYTAYSTGWENLKKPEIKEAIQSHIKTITDNADKDIIENINFWRSMRDNPEIPEAQRLKASEHLARYRAMFTERIEQTETSKIKVEFIES